MASWLVNPWLLGAGALLVAAPIIIHLLNKRKFRIIDWAAMDFLLEADQRNRRRIQLEELLLLALRCLAVFLTGLLVARPFLPSNLTRGWFQTVRTERVVLLDDSPSMEATADGSSAFGRARTQLGEFVAALAQRGSGDSLTLVLTSRPTRPVLTDVPVNDQTLAELQGEIEALAVSDLGCRLEAACVEVRGLMGGRSDKINRVVYLLTDLRKGDWLAASEAETEEAVPQADAVIEAVRSLAEDAAGCFVVDLGDDESVGNLSVVGIAPQDKALLSGVSSRFNVTVRNYGAQTLRDVPIKFIAGGSLPLTAKLESVPAGGTASAVFSYLFPPWDPAVGEEPPEPVELQVQLDEVAGSDALAADNVAYYAARVRPGIPTLIVDGDPSSEYGRAETFFLRRALAPPGLVASGIQVETISDTEFETRPLAPYQVVYLCNVYHVSEQRRKSLEEWVRAGGGLVIWPGGQVDERHYNEQLYAGGAGLLPRRLERVAGDETEEQWVTFSVDQPDHPAVQVFQGDAAPLLESAKVFQWWVVAEGGGKSGGSRMEDRGSRMDDAPSAPSSILDPPSSTVLRLTDPERSAAVIDRPFGRGRVMQVTVPADTDWSNWPEDASYLIILQELNRYLAQTAADPGQLTVGEPLRQPLDLTRHRAEATVTRPDGESVTRQAVASDSENRENRAVNEAAWVVKYDDTDRRGFYRVGLTRTDGPDEALLFAANLHPDEGNLQRVEADLLTRAWEGTTIELVRGGELAALTAEGSKGELWFRVLVLLMGVLFTEQALAWWFGRSR